MHFFTQVPGSDELDADTLDYEADAADLNNEPAADNDDDAEPANSRTATPP